MNHAETLQGLIRELDGALADQTGGRVTCTTTAEVLPNGELRLRTEAAIALGGVRQTIIDADVPAKEVARKIVETHYRPFQKTLDDATLAAATVWTETLERS